MYLLVIAITCSEEEQESKYLLLFLCSEKFFTFISFALSYETVH